MMVEIARAGNVVLCINNLHDLVSDGKTAEKGLDVSEALSEFVGRGHGVLVIATTSVGGYNRTIAHSQLGAGFSRIDVAEMNDNQAIQVLESKVGGIEYKHKVFFSYDALATAVKLAGRFLPDERLPESAVTLIAESASAARSARGEHTLVSDQDIAGIISEKTGIPVTSLDQDERARLLHLEEEMHRRVIGQDTAVSLVANALKRARAEIRSTKRPIANFLFLGPTGVGKTELAKTIAETYFGGEQRMIRIDMSEYQGANSVYRLIGQPGQQGTGILTEAVRQQPFSLVLLDELEKADKDVLNLFLQVFDDGRLTDSVGRTIDFTNTIIIATSNAGTAYVAEQS
jgi:ATP-dependent Clp protease ATP-binding subunit ClpC